MDDRRMRYNHKVGSQEVKRQQVASVARRYIREFATKDDVDALVRLYQETHYNETGDDRGTV